MVAAIVGVGKTARGVDTRAPGFPEEGKPRGRGRSGLVRGFGEVSQPFTAPMMTPLVKCFWTSG